jgi:hypothetical protein
MPTQINNRELIQLLDTYFMRRQVVGAASGYRVISYGEKGNLVVGSTLLRFYPPKGNWTMLDVRVSVNIAPTGLAAIWDVHKNAAGTIFTTVGNRPTIAIGAFTILSPAPDIIALTDTDYVTFWIDQVGSAVIGADYVIELNLLGV